MDSRKLPSPIRRFGLRSGSLGMALPALTALLAAAPTRVPLQPLAQQVRQLETTLAYLGAPLPPKDQEAINQAIAQSDEAVALAGLEQILDQYTLAMVDINPESRVKVRPGLAQPELVEAGTRAFLVKVNNQAGVTARLEAESPNALPIYVPSDSSAEPPQKITSADLRDRWMSLEVYHQDPLLSGLPLEYRIVEIYSRDHGPRSAQLRFHVGQGTQDLGFRNEMMMFFMRCPPMPCNSRFATTVVPRRSRPLPFGTAQAASIRIPRSA